MNFKCAFCLLLRLLWVCLDWDSRRSAYCCNVCFEILCASDFSASLRVYKLSMVSFHLLIVFSMFLRCLLKCSRFGMNLRPYVVMVESSVGSGSPLRFHICRLSHFCIVILWFSKVHGRLVGHCPSSDDCG